MRLNQLDGLLAFWKVAEHRGFSAAAAALEVSPSALSQAIRSLEARLGVRLLNRTTRSVSLTEAGEAYLSRVGPALGDVLDAGEQLNGLQGRPSGVLRINAARISIAMVLKPLLAGFLRACPDVQIELATGTSGALVARVLAYELEAAFVAEPFTAEGLDMLHVFDEELVLISPKGVAPRTVIAFPGGCSYRRRLEEWLGKEAVVASRVIEFASYHAIIACVAAGTGIAIVPRSVLKIVGAERQVVVKELPAKVARAKTQLVWRHGHHSVALGALRQLVGV